MRLAAFLALMAVVVVVLCPPGLTQDKKKGDKSLFESAPPPPPSGNSVTVIQGMKRYNGWNTDNGRIFVENPDGKIIMDGWMKRTGAVEIYSRIDDDSYVGQLNPMGNGLLMSPKTGATIRMEAQR